MTRSVARWMLGKAKAELRNHRKEHRVAAKNWRIYASMNREHRTWKSECEEDNSWRWMALERKTLRQLREVVRDLRTSSIFSILNATDGRGAP